MEIQPLKEDDLLPNEMRVEPAYLERARDSGRYFSFVAVEGGRVWGFAEATLQFHPTRGTAMRVRFVYGPDKALRPFLATFCAYADRLDLCAVYLTSSPYHPQLCTAAKAMKFCRIEGNFAMRRRERRIGEFSVEGIRVRPMLPGEYLGIRQTFMRDVSAGPYTSNESEVRFHMESQLFFPAVAVADDGRIAAYAELALVHAGPAACTVGRIERVVVDAAHRGRNISRLLVGELLRKAGNLGCPHVDLQVRSGNVPAIRTYEALGFARTDDIPYWCNPRSAD